jgi:hypothetical protein
MTRRIIIIETVGFLWWKKTMRTEYEGDVTVWHNVKTGKRASTNREMLLADIAWKANHDYIVGPVIKDLR